MLLDQCEESSYEFVALVVAHLTECDLAAEVLVTVRIATRAPERTFAGDFDRECRTITAKDTPPCGEYTFHLVNISESLTTD
jgi:hypothetical protein